MFLVLEKNTVSDFLTMKEASSRCRVGLSTMYRLVSGSDGLPCYRVGAKRLVKASDLEAWLECNREPRAA